MLGSWLGGYAVEGDGEDDDEDDDEGMMRSLFPIAAGLSLPLPPATTQFNTHKKFIGLSYTPKIFLCIAPTSENRQLIYKPVQYFARTWASLRSSHESRNSLRNSP